MEEIKQTKTIETQVKTKKKKKRKPLGAHKAARYILIIGIIIILIPCVLLGIILISASRVGGSPVNGNRFEKDLNPAITSSDVESIQSSINGISGVESAVVNLTTGQLRITVDTKDSLENSEIEDICYDAYDIVTKKLAVGTYFTNSSSKRMYDLEVTVYNYADDEKADMICWNVQKNGQMEEPVYKELTKPNDEDLVKELRGELIEEEPEE